MKTLILIIITLLLTTPCFAGSGSVAITLSGTAGAGGASCQATAFYDSFGTPAGYVRAGASTDEYYAGSSTFNPGANKSVCKVNVKLACPNAGCAGQNYYIALFTMNGTSLNTLLGTSNAVTGSDAWNVTTVAFTFATPVALTNGTSYGLVVYTTTANGDDLVRISRHDATGTTSEWDSAKAINSGYTATSTLLEVQAFAYE
jgi:hypothetical protein